jgi:site-specific DNA recombinase
MKVAIYVRVSTNQQQKTQTIEQQITSLKNHIAIQTGWQLAQEHIYCDDGYSGRKLNRPGLDRLRDQAAMAAFERVLITVPDRLARNYVHQVLLIEELAKLGCEVEFLDRPMSKDPHDQLLLQIRGAVAEYELSLIADRMRRGRQAKMRSGEMLPWIRTPYGYIADSQHPRNASLVKIDPVKAAVIEQIFSWYSDPKEAVTLYCVAKRLTEQHIPTPTGTARWNVATIRGILRSTVYTGIAYSGRTRSAPTRQRKSALKPAGPGISHKPTPPQEWITIPVPAIISQEIFDAVQQRLDRNKQMARRNNTAHNYLLRGLVSCGQCQLSCTGRMVKPGYDYYLCRGRFDPLRAVKGERCTSRYVPAKRLDEIVWKDLCKILTNSALITHQLEHAKAGEWLPQALQARQRTIRQTMVQLERQQARLLEVYLAEIIGRDEFDRKRQELANTHNGLVQQLRQIEAQAKKQMDLTILAEGIDAFSHRVAPTLNKLTFAQRRKLVELLVDCVIVSNGEVEIRYVIPTSPEGEKSLFCHLHKDYLNGPARAIPQNMLLISEMECIRHQILCSSSLHSGVIFDYRQLHKAVCQSNLKRTGSYSKSIVIVIVGFLYSTGYLSHTQFFFVIIDIGILLGTSDPIESQTFEQGQVFSTRIPIVKENKLCSYSTPNQFPYQRASQFILTAVMDTRREPHSTNFSFLTLAVESTTSFGRFGVICYFAPTFLFTAKFTFTTLLLFSSAWPFLPKCKQQWYGKPAITPDNKDQSLSKNMAFVAVVVIPKAEGYLAGKWLWYQHVINNEITFNPQRYYKTDRKDCPLCKTPTQGLQHPVELIVRDNSYCCRNCRGGHIFLCDQTCDINCYHQPVLRRQQTQIRSQIAESLYQTDDQVKACPSAFSQFCCIIILFQEHILRPSLLLQWIGLGLELCSIFISNSKNYRALALAA